MHGHAGRLADRHQPERHRLRVAIARRHCLAVQVGRDAAHVVVHGRDHRDRLTRHVHAGKYACGFADAGQTLGQQVGAQVQRDMVLARAAAAALVDLHRHRPADHVASGQVLGGGRVAFHEPLALVVGQVAAFAARALGDQAARAVDAGRVELGESHVLQRQAGAQRHGVAVARAGVCRGAGGIDTAVAACRQRGAMGGETVQRAIFQVPCQHAAAGAVVIRQQVEREILHEELGALLQALLVKRVQDGVAGAVGGGAGALRHAHAVLQRLPAERTLADQAGLGAGERHAVRLQLQHRRRCFAAHELDRVLITEPVRSLHRIVHMEAPVVAVAHAALGGDGVAARGEHFRDTGGSQSGGGHTQRGAHPGAARADYHHVIAVPDDVVGAGHGTAPCSERIDLSTQRNSRMGEVRCRRLLMQGDVGPGHATRSWYSVIANISKQDELRMPTDRKQIPRLAHERDA